MRLKKIKPIVAFNDNEWHDWFAWYPVIAENEHGDERLVWLEQCRRRYSLFGYGGHRTVYYKFTELNT